MKIEDEAIWLNKIFDKSIDVLQGTLILIAHIYFNFKNGKLITSEIQSRA